MENSESSGVAVEEQRRTVAGAPASVGIPAQMRGKGQEGQLEAVARSSSALATLRDWCTSDGTAGPSHLGQGSLRVSPAALLTRPSVPSVVATRRHRVAIILATPAGRTERSDWSKRNRLFRSRGLYVHRWHQASRCTAGAPLSAGRHRRGPLPTTAKLDPTSQASSRASF